MILTVYLFFNSVLVCVATLQVINYSSTIFFSSDGDDSSVGASFHCVSQNGAVINVEGMKRAYNYLSHCWHGGQLLKNTSFSLCDINPVLPNDSIDVLL